MKKLTLQVLQRGCKRPGEDPEDIYEWTDPDFQKYILDLTSSDIRLLSEYITGLKPIEELINPEKAVNDPTNAKKLMLSNRQINQLFKDARSKVSYYNDIITFPRLFNMPKI
jgi:hypothetical protein